MSLLFKGYGIALPCPVSYSPAIPFHHTLYPPPPTLVNVVSIKSALVTLALSTTALAGVRCGSSELEAPKDQLQQCIDELHARDQELCTVPAGQLNMGFVHIGTAMITGVHNDGNTEEDTSSWWYVGCIAVYLLDWIADRWASTI